MDTSVDDRCVCSQNRFLWDFVSLFPAFMKVLCVLLRSFSLIIQGKERSPEEKRVAICIFDDVAEQCREAAIK